MLGQREEIEQGLDDLRDQFIAEYLRFLDLPDFDTSDALSYVYVDDVPDDSPVAGHAVVFGAAMVPRAGKDEINKLGRVFQNAYGEFEKSWENSL
ncbi:MAG: hypothetical protein F4Y35_08725 [Chloroflexi bacterium]|nr:hypothetical protein [Chloroflexota bacterium]